MPENTKKPFIRFAGFTDSWEQQKLGSMVQSFEYGLNAAAMRYDGVNKYLRITDIDDETHEFKIDTLTTPDIDLSKADDYRLQEGDVLFARTGASVGKTYQYKDFDGLVYFAGFLIRARTKPEYESGFVFQNTLTDKYNRYITVTSQRSGQPGVNAKEYADYNISTPNLDEQRKLSEFFERIDHLITLNQRKYEKMVFVKKSILEKMFPKNGSNIPEIRFAGFTDSWEQRKLLELADFSKGSGYSKGELLESGTPIILYGQLYTSYETIISKVDTFANKKKNSVLSKGGEVIVPASGETAEDISRASVVKNAGIILGGDLNIIKPKPEIDPAFLAITISNGEQQKELTRRAQGKSVVHIRNSDLQQVIVFYPEPDEQKKICALFYDFDNLITLHQRKLEKLKNIKKSMLEKMFV